MTGALISCMLIDEETATDPPVKKENMLISNF